MREEQASKVSPTERVGSRWIAVIIVLAAVAASYQVSQAWPGWFFFDSAHQWKVGERMVRDGPGALLSQNTHWPMGPFLLRYLWLQADLSFGAWAWTQACMLNLAITFALLIIGLRGIWVVVISIFFWIHPIVANYAIFHSSDTPAAICILVIFGLLNRHERYRFVGGCVLVGTVFLLCSLRYNAVSVAPIIAVMTFYLRSTRGMRRLILPFLILAMPLVYSAAEGLASRPRASVLAPGIIRRNLHLYELQPTERAADVLRSSRVPWPSPYTPLCLSTMWCYKGVRGAMSEQIEKINIDLYMWYWREYPAVAFRSLLSFLSYDLGYAAPLKEEEIGDFNGIPPRLSSRGQIPERLVPQVAKLHEATAQWHGIAARPWLHITGLVVLIVICRAAGRRDLTGRCGSALALSCGLVLPLALVSLTTELRYYFPAGILMVVVITGVTVRLFVESRLIRGGIRKGMVWATNIS